MSTEFEITRRGLERPTEILRLRSGDDDRGEDFVLTRRTHPIAEIRAHYPPVWALNDDERSIVLGFNRQIVVLVVEPSLAVSKSYEVGSPVVEFVRLAGGDWLVMCQADVMRVNQGGASIWWTATDHIEDYRIEDDTLFVQTMDGSNPRISLENGLLIAEGTSWPSERVRGC